MDSSAHDKQIIMDSHIRAFHSISGSTNYETTKNFWAFERSLNYEKFDQESFFSALKAKNVGEELFRIKLLSKFGRYEDSLKTLIKGPVWFTKPILADLKLIEYITARYSGEVLIKNIFEEVSFKARAKLINKLAFQIKDEGKALEYFNAVLGKYGLKIAKPLLIACAEDVIIRAVVEDEVEFKHAELLRCYEKSKKILKVYFEKNEKFQLFTKLGQYLAVNDVDFFHTLIKHGFPKIGNKAMVKYLEAYKKEAIEDSKNLKNMIYFNLKWKCFSEEQMVRCFINLLPNDVNDFGYDCTWYLEKIPLKTRGKVLFVSFKEKYGFEIWDLKEHSFDSILEMLALEDRRRFDLSDLIQFESTEKAIPVLENRLHLTNHSQGRNLVMNMIITNCRCNNDYEALLKVLQRFAKQQKNELKQFRFAFISDILKFNFKKFTEEHWKCIDEIILHCHLNDEYSYPLNDIVLKYIEYRISKNLDYTLYLKIFLKITGTYYFPEISKEKPETQRETILKFHSAMQEITDIEPLYGHTSFITSVVNFNNKNRKNKRLQIRLSDYQDSLKFVTEDLQNKYPNFHELEKLLKSLEKEGNNDVMEILLEVSFKKGNGYLQKWFLNNKPGLIEDKIEVVLKSSKLRKDFLYALLKLESPLKEKITNRAIEIVKNPEGKKTSEVCSSLTILSPLWDFDAKRWIPVEFKINAQKEGMKELFEIQKALINTYKTRRDLVKVIPEVLQFCRGDYLKYALKSLYYLSTNIPEKFLIEPLQELSGRSVSARKHVLMIVTFSSSLELKRKILKQYANSETNSSVKKIIVQSLYKCLKDDRTEEDWAIFNSHLHFIDSEDKEIDQLFFAKSIPGRFYSRFIALIWNHLRQRGKHEEFKLFECLDYKKFDFEDCEGIIKTSLLNPKNKYAEETYNFVLKYLLKTAKSSKDALENKLRFIWGRFQEMPKTVNRHEFQISVYNFFAFFCKKLLSKDAKEKLYRNKDLLKIIETMIELIPLLQIPNCRNFLINLLLKTTVLYMTSIHNSTVSRNMDCDQTNSTVDEQAAIQTFSQGVLQELKSLIQAHGVFIVTAYAKLLVDFFKLIDDETFVLCLIEAISNCDNSIEVRSFCVALLPEVVPKNTILREKYFELLKILEDGCVEIGLAIEAHVLHVSF